MSSGLLIAVREKARSLKRTIVLQDATDPRIIQAAREICEKHIARPVLVGSETSIRHAAKDIGPLDGIPIEDPDQSPRLGEFSRELFNLRTSKGMTLPEAERLMRNPLFFGAMMVRTGLADGSVAGSLSTTGDVLRAGIQVIGVAEGISIASSFFLMVFPNVVYSFADCAVVPDPTAEQLADIAITTAQNHRRLTGEEPLVAMLSFSTRGSASHPRVEKIRTATDIIRTKRPDLKVDGELQLDAAIDPAVARRKAPGSILAGHANVLIFPDLDSGNIGYKMAERMAGAEAIGPLVQGLRKPAFDLSRGCSVNDIVNVSAINAVMGSD